MKLLDWTDVSLVIKTMIENKINLNELNADDIYLIEKITDSIFDKVRKKTIIRASKIKVHIENEVEPITIIKT